MSWSRPLRKQSVRGETWHQKAEHSAAWSRGWHDLRRAHITLALDNGAPLLNILGAEDLLVKQFPHGFEPLWFDMAETLGE